MMLDLYRCAGLCSSGCGDKLPTCPGFRGQVGNLPPHGTIPHGHLAQHGTARAAPRPAAAAVELALLLPLLTLLLVISVDFARLYYHYMTITNCARNGAMWLCDPVAQSF